MTTFTYTLPDGRNDAPDENGCHTATVNVMHSAEQLNRFPGCEDCKSCADHDIHAQHVVGIYGGWDPVSETFASSEIRVTFTPGCPVCERGKS